MAGQHFWQVGMRGFTIRDLKQRMSHYFSVLSTYRNPDRPVSQNFLLSPKSTHENRLLFGKSGYRQLTGRRKSPQLLAPATLHPFNYHAFIECHYLHAHNCWTNYTTAQSGSRAAPDAFANALRKTTRMRLSRTMRCLSSRVSA